MTWYHSAVLVIHLLVSLSLVILVLLQQSKGTDVSAGLSDGGRMFSTSSGEDFLSRATTLCAVMFLITSMSLTYFAYQGESFFSGSVIKRVQAEEVIEEVSLPEDADATVYDVPVQP